MLEVWGYWCPQHRVVLPCLVLYPETRAGGVETEVLLEPEALYSGA